ncbi:MAG: carboxypeptidase regulatory-like domain-containing protein, partial [Armatimonadota bacterium]
AGWIGTNDIVFSAKLEGAGETYHLYTINTTTLNVFQITDGAANERNPVVSPDGRYIAFDSDAAPSVAGDAYAGGTSPRSETLAGDPATATAVNGSGRRNIFISGIYGAKAVQFTNRYAAAVDTDNAEPSFSSLRANPFTNATGNNLYVAFSSTRRPDVPGAPTAFTNGTTYDLYMVRASNDGGTTLTVEAAPTDANLGAKRVDTVDDGYAYNDHYPSWSPVVNQTRFAFQSDRTGGLLVNGFGDGFTATPGTNDLFIASAVDISAPTLVRFDTNTSTGEVVHINLGTTYNAGASVRTRDNGLLPGQSVFFTVRADDREAGIGRVYLQFKNPNSYFQAANQGGNAAEHKEYLVRRLFGSIIFGQYVFQEGNPPSPLWLENVQNGSALGFEYEAEVVALDGSTYYRHTPSPGPRNVIPVAGSSDAQAFSGVNQPILDGQGGRANAWLELKPVVDGDGNPVRPADGQGGVLYGASWTLPAEASDWFIDVIMFDKAVNPYPQGLNSAQNWIIYDNVWGFSTALPLSAQEKDILFVSDYTLGQKFFSARLGQGGTPSNLQPISYGAESYYTDSDMVRYPSEQTPSAAAPAPGATDLRVWSNTGPWRNDGVGYTYGRTANGTIVNPGYPHPLGVGSYVDRLLEWTSVTASNGSRYALPKAGRYSIWRTLARGPVPAELLQSYLPSSVSQPADTRVGEKSARTVPVYDRLVVWASPFSGNLFVGPGSITDLNTQQALTQFVTAGGRLFISGQDIGFALAGNGQSNAFFNNVLKARYAADVNGGAASINAVGTTRFNTDGFLGGQHAYGETTDGSIYNYLSAAARPALLNSFNVPTTGVSDAALTSDSSFGAYLDVVTGLAGTNVEFGYNNSGNPGILSSTFPGGGNVFYAPFGFESVSNDWYTWTPAGGGAVRIANRGTRAKIMANYSLGYRTGTFTGRFIDEQGSPVSDALVRLIAGAENQPAAGTAITDAGGFFQIDGVIPGTYSVYGYKPGYYTQHTAGDIVNGTGRRNISLVLKRANPGKLTNIPPAANGANPNAAGIFAIDKTTPIPGIEVQARRVNPDGRTTVFSAVSRDNTDARFPAGSYELKDLLIGEYAVIVNAPDTYDNAGNLVANPRYNSGYGTIKITANPQADKFALGTGTTVVDRDGTSVLLIEEDKTSQIDVYLPSAPQPVSGKVVDAGTNDPIEGAFVTAISATTQTVVATGTTNAQGEYQLRTTGTPSLDVLMAGGYTITASKAGYSNATTPLTVTGTVPVVAPTLKLTKLPPGKVSGLVVGINGAAIVDAEVSFFLIQGGVVSSTPIVPPVKTTAKQTVGGYSFNFVVDPLDAGDYVVTVAKPGLVGDPVQLRVTIASGAETKNVKFRMLPPRVYGDGLQLVSTPFNYTGIGTRDIFGLSATGDNDGDGDAGDAADVAIFNQFAVADWTGLDYLTGAELPFQSGRGYFVRFGAITSVVKTGTAVAGSTFTVRLQPGWNLVGNPFANASNASAPGPDLDLYANGTIVDGNGSQYTITEAVQNNLIRGTLFGYTGSNNGSQYFETRVMKAWNGYWIRNASAGALDLVLRYPDSRSARVAPKSTVSLADIEKPVFRSIEGSKGAGWRMRLVATQGRLIDSDNTIGVSPEAKDGFDPMFDNEKPPMLVQAPGVYIGIEGINETGRSMDFADQVRSSGSGTKSWNFRVAANTDGDIVLTWPNMNRIPRNLEPVLVDMATGRKVAMRGTGSYRVAHSGRSEHKFRIEVGPGATTPLAIGKLRVNSGRGTGYRIAFTMSRAADASVEVSTMSGRVIRRFETRSEQGVESTVLWDGRDLNGASVPAGTYLVNVTARDETGRTARQRVPIGTVR